MRVEQISETCVVYCGDCRDIAPTLAGVDAVVSDPPYGMKWDADSTRFTGGHRKRGEGRSTWGAIVDDGRPFDPAPWLDFPAVVLWGSNHYAARLPVGRTLVWIKRKEELFGSFLSDGEIGWAKGGHGVYCHADARGMVARVREGGGEVAAHPTQKPLSLMRWCIEKFAPKATRILDPYMGSGTTGCAALALGRAFVGIELQPAYFDTACRRLERAVVSPSQAALFAPPVAAEPENQEALVL